MVHAGQDFNGAPEAVSVVAVGAQEVVLAIEVEGVVQEGLDVAREAALEVDVAVVASRDPN